MRKYRGKRISNEKISGCIFREDNFVHGYYFHRESDNKDFISFSHPGHLGKLIVMSVEVIPESVGQSTGLKDKNGEIDVYVGDNIYFSMSQTQHYKGYVKWSKKSLCYLVECYWQKQDEIPHLCDGFEMKYQYEGTCIRRLDSECFDIEIIHDDKKLLESK